MPALLPWPDAPPPDDSVLLDEGVMRAAPPGPSPERVMLITCGALFTAVQHCIARQGWWHVDTECLPARLHVRPEAIAPALRSRARVAMARGYGSCAALFGDCGSDGAIAARCADEGVAVTAVPHCGAMYDPRLAAPLPGEDGIFYLTDFMLRHFETLIWQPMRLEAHAELIDLLFAPFDRIVHLAQHDDPTLDATALSVAVRLNMPLEKRPAPPDRLAALIGPLVLGAAPPS